MAAPAYLALVLHAHLPFVRHPEHERFLEEDWFFEALTETYLPLLDVLEGLARDGIRYRLTFSLSPTLLSMLSDPLLQQRYRDYLDQRLHALAGEVVVLLGEADAVGCLLDDRQETLGQLCAGGAFEIIRSEEHTS